MPDDRIQSVSRFRRFALAVCVIGVLVQLGLTAYYLGMGHRAQPHHVPVGLVVAGRQADRASSCCWSEKGTFRVTDYATVGRPGHRDQAARGVRRRRHHRLPAAPLRRGGRRPGGGDPAAHHLHRGRAAADRRRSSPTLAKQGDRMPVAQAQALNTPPAITDVVPLPADDVNGASLGFLTQALALGGTVASMGLGRLIPRTRRSLAARRRARQHARRVRGRFGRRGPVVDELVRRRRGADRGEMLAIFALISLAITGSTAGAVALFGPAGALIGALYFTLGTVISGASILPEFLPAFGRQVGENLPTGAGVQAVRDNLYFPAAPIGGHLTVLGLYAGIGCLIVLITNMLPNRGDHTSEVELDLVERLEGAERREPVTAGILNRPVIRPIVKRPCPVRTRVSVPLRFADGYATTAEVITFTGLADGKEHLALRARRRRAGTPLVRLHSECLTGDVFGSRALRLRPAAARGGRADRRRRRLPALPAAGGARDRALRQARRVRAAGRRDGHVRGEPGARARRRRAGLHRGRADAHRPGRHGRSTCSPTTRIKRHNCDRTASTVRERGCRPRCTPPPPTSRYLQAKVSHTRHTIDLRWPADSRLAAQIPVARAERNSAWESRE